MYWKSKVLEEVSFRFGPSSGPGGQSVNKVATRVELYFDLSNTIAFKEVDLVRLKQKLSSLITKAGVVRISCDIHRSQYKNKKEAINRLLETISKALQREKPRKATKPTKESKEKRHKNKQKQSEKKALRKKQDWIEKT